MIFITGGAFQGKQAYARALSGLEEEAFLRRTADGTVLRKEGESGSTAKALAGKTILVNYQGFVRQALERGEDVLDMTSQVLALEPDLVTMDEVGCGIIPLEKKERQYRDLAGAAGQMLAASAREVYRVVAGIPVRIR